MTKKTARVHLTFDGEDKYFEGDNAMTVISQLKAKKDISVVVDGEKFVVPYHAVLSAEIEYSYEEVTNPTDAICPQLIEETQ